MLRGMHRGLLGSVLTAWILTAACGGTTDYDPSGGSSGGASPKGTGGLGTGGGVPFDGSVPLDVPDSATDVHSDYEAPVCPDASPPPVTQECDLFGGADDCPPGLGCFPFVEYPAPGDDCAQERYGTECLVVGEGLQGDPCEAGDCAARHLCVLTGDGTICVELCSTFGADTCPAGLLCEPIDVQPGVGGCY
jgi:hypothetical protein